MLSKTPYLVYSGTMKMKGGATALAIDFTRGKADMEVVPHAHDNKVSIEINTSGGLSRSSVYNVAKNSFDQGDIASTIHTLLPYAKTFDAQENILMGKAYWKIAYPYYMKTYSMKALKYMSEGVKAHPPGLKAEEVILEYTHMLKAAGMHTEAMNYITFLEGSLSSDILAEAYLIDMDILNSKKQFQDAYVQNRRMLNALDKDVIPPRLMAYYHSVLGDTYLGFQAASQALDLYKKALLDNPSLFRSDPTLYSRMAEASFKIKDYAMAKEYILLAINLSRKDEKPAYLISLGDCLYQLGIRDKAMGVLSQVESISTQSESTIIAKLKTARIMQDSDIAKNGKLSIETFRQITYIYEDLKATQEYKDGPLGPVIKVRIAQTFALREQWEDALEAYRIAWIESARTDPMHRYAQSEAEKCMATLIQNLAAKGNKTRIYELYTQYQDSFIQEMQDPEALYIIGRILSDTGYMDQARPLFAACAKFKSPRTEPALSALTTIDYRKAAYASALQWNARYLQEYPQGREIVTMTSFRGELLYHLARYSEAVPFLQYGISKGGARMLLDLSLLADCHHKLGDPAKEGAYLDRIISYSASTKSPVIEKTLYLRATQLKEASAFARSRELYRKLLGTYPQSSYRDWTWYHLAEVSHGEGRDEEAKKYLDAVIRRSTDATLKSLASNYLSSISLGTDVDEYDRLINQFGEK